jgi:hypothetical protein
MLASYYFEVTMNINRFKEILHEKRPDIKGTIRYNPVTHNVAIIQNNINNSYHIAGSFSEVLNKLDILNITANDLEDIKIHLDRLIRTNGLLFNNTKVDNTEQIEYYKNMINLIEEEYVIL